MGRLNTLRAVYTTGKRNSLYSGVPLFRWVMYKMSFKVHGDSAKDELLLPEPCEGVKWYEIDGHRIFQIRDFDGKIIGFIAYLIFDNSVLTDLIKGAEVTTFDESIMIRCPWCDGAMHYPRKIFQLNSD